MRILLLILHVLSGSVGLLSGTTAIIAAKGDRLHRAAGNTFTVAMLTLSGSGLCLAILKSQRGNMIGSIVTFYMIGTAWLAGRRRDGPSWLDWTSFLAGLAGAAAAITVGIYTLRNPELARGAPAGMSLFFGAVLLLSALGDLRIVLRHEIQNSRRIRRHLWRMCFGLFIATGSFFLGQQQVFPAFLRGTLFLTVPALLPLALLVYWLIRVRFSKTYRVRPLINMASSSS